MSREEKSEDHKHQRVRPLRITMFLTLRLRRVPGLVGEALDLDVLPPDCDPEASLAKHKEKGAL